MTPGQSVTVSPAIWPRDTAAATFLLRGYFDFLHNSPATLKQQHLASHERELAQLPSIWGGDRSVMLLARQKGNLLGCVGVHLLTSDLRAAEMKRLWTVPGARGLGLGRQLIHAAIAWARSHSARELLLDTLPAVMPEAQHLYRSMGFRECERYNQNPIPGLVYFRLQLE